jgi:diamine N-acetyltransferase
MTIRKITSSDLPQLVDISKKTFTEAFADQNNPDDFYSYLETAFTLRTLTDEFNTEGALFYFLENENAKPIGYFKINHHKSPLQTTKPNIKIQYDFDNAKATELERIYVLSEYHGKGAAQLLMTYIIDEAQKNKSDFVWLGVWEYNLKAIRFYQKFGFEKFGSHIFDVGNDPQTDWLMWKKIV